MIEIEIIDAEIGKSEGFPYGNPRPPYSSHLCSH